MRSGGFDYQYTCPAIDRQINSAKQILHGFVRDLLEKACPLLSKQTLDELAEENAEALYKDLEDCFETVRRENEKMRDSANDQVTDLQERVRDLESEIERIEREAK